MGALSDLNDFKFISELLFLGISVKDWSFMNF